MKTIAIGEVFTDEQLQKAVQIYKKGGRAKELHDAITKPGLEHINQVTRQENSPMYWAYALEYACSQLLNR